MSNVDALNGLLREYVYVESLHLESEDGLSSYNLLMTLAKSSRPGAKNIAITFFNVGGLEIRGGWWFDTVHGSLCVEG